MIIFTYPFLLFNESNLKETIVWKIYNSIIFFYFLLFELFELHYQ